MGRPPLSLSFALAACAKMDRSAPMQSNLSAAAAPGAAKESDGNGPTERKIIRRAELSIESSDPSAAQKKATELAEKLGGFVVSSDVHHSGDVGGDGEYVTVSLVLRVPADRFAAALDELRRLLPGYFLVRFVIRRARRRRAKA
jgi:hypothetical protein